MEACSWKEEYFKVLDRCRHLEAEKLELVETLAQCQHENSQYKVLVSRLEEEISVLQSSLQRDSDLSITSLGSVCGLSLPLQHSLERRSLQKKARASLEAARKKPSFEKLRIFENFFILGLPPCPEDNQAATTELGVLFQYPETCAFNAAVLADFAFPQGCQLEELDLSESGSALYSALYRNVQRSEACFVFTIKSNDVRRLHSLDIANNDREVLYCCCVITYDVEGTRVSPLCYCLVSYFPCFELHFEVLFKILSIKKIQRMNEKPYLSTDKLISTETEVSWHDAEGEELGLLEEYFESFSFDETHIAINLQSVESIDYTLSNLPLLDCEWTCPVLFSLLTVDDFFKVLATVMLERSVVFISSNMDYVSSCILAVTGLLRPFKWQHLICPLLPEALKDVLEAPVPLLVGIMTHPEESLNHLVFVDLDEPRREDRVKSFDQVEIYADGLKERLRPFFEKLQLGGVYDMDSVQKQVVGEIVHEIRDAWNEIISRIPLEAADMSDLKFRVLQQTKHQDLPFMKHLVETQLFIRAAEDIASL